MYINDTSSYYKNSPELFHEITISQCLSSKDTPYIDLLAKEGLYADFIADFLLKYKKDFNKIVEIGGGYGYLMERLSKRLKPKEIIMVDISKKFLTCQKDKLSHLQKTKINFINLDALSFIKSLKKEVDIIILNEVIGDLKTLINVSAEEFCGAFQFNVEYLPKRFNVNIEALEFINLASFKTKSILIVEHSSTYEIPEKFKECLEDEKENFSPKEIKLYGHSEYTINFKMLEEAAQYAGFNTVRKHLMDIIPLKYNELISFVLKSKSIQTDFHEIINEFYNHIKEYEVLFCYR